jgi:hypothetical protein
MPRQVPQIQRLVGRGLFSEFIRKPVAFGRTVASTVLALAIGFETVIFPSMDWRMDRCRETQLLVGGFDDKSVSDARRSTRRQLNFLRGSEKLPPS